ncbi:hypothetical protein JYU02_01025 [bacterium AH-315-P15]|nr:hypothetical protein [bacterium AH-315-P15]
MRVFVSLIAALVFVPALAYADGADLHGMWEMTSMDGESLEGIEGRFRYTFRADGVLVTETPFTTYDGIWAEDGPGRVALVLMSEMPDVAANSCDYQVDGNALRISNCGNGGPPAEFVRAQ